MASGRGERWSLGIEWTFAIGVVGTLIMNAVKLFKTHAQPQPFFFAIDDVFGDWFNTAQYSHLPGAYDSWGSIYPPISFVFLKIFSKGVCYESYGMEVARECDWIGRYTLFASFLLACWAASRCFRYLDRRTAWPRTIAFSCGLPLWYGLERGQLLLVTFPLLVLAHGPLRLRSAPARWLASAIAINFKPYTLAGIAADLARGRWRAAEMTTLLTIVVYTVTWMAFGDGDPLTVLRNIQAFSGGFGGGWGEIYYAATFKSLITMLSENPIAILALGIHTASLGAGLFTVLLWIGQGTIALTLALAFLRPGIATRYRLAGLALALAIISTQTGGYSMMVIVFFAFLEPMRGPGRTIAVVSAYVLSLQADWVIATVVKLYQQSYLFGGYAEQTYGVGAGVVLRPLLVLVIQYSLCAVSIHRFARLWTEDRQRLRSIDSTTSLAPGA